MVLISILATIFWGLKLSIDFKGGSLLEIQFIKDRPANSDIQNILNGFSLGDPTIQPSAEKDMIIRTLTMDEAMHQKIINAIKAKYEIEELRFESVGPAIGQELKKKAISSIILGELFMIIYLSWAFRKTSFVVKSYKYGVLAALSLLHDLTIVTGLFAILGHFFGIEVGLTFVAALLTILGYSVNDTIVIYDRIRENLLRLKERESFEQLVDRSLKQTIARSINTTLTVLISIAAVLIFGGESIRYFMLALFVGVASGAYSSFLAAFMLVSWELKDQK